MGRHLPPALDGARLDRQVAAIAERVARRPRGRILSSLAVRTTCGSVVALAAIVSIMAVRSRLIARLRAEPPGAALAGTTFEAPTGGETITLGDGSRAVLEARSKLTLVTVRPELVRVALERGGVDLDVVHAEGKQFVVEARGYEIRVLGTRFSVRMGGSEGGTALEVRVARGRVRVTRESEDGAGEGQDVRVLDAGETWSTAPVAESEGAPPSQPKPPVAASSGESSSALLARAEAFRAANEPRAAARLFDALRARHRSDPRAGLAAFELGRLRLDRLDDPRGAAEAFNDSIAVAPNAPFREDAQARLVEAYDAARDRSRCLGARAAYLLRYPRGVHRDKIAARCPE